MKYLFLNNENIDVCLPPYLRINITIWLKRQIPDFDILIVNNTYAKLAPDSILNPKIKEIMRYTGGHRTSPLYFGFCQTFQPNRCVADEVLGN